MTAVPGKNVSVDTAIMARPSILIIRYDGEVCHIPTYVDMGSFVLIRCYTQEREMIAMTLMNLGKATPFVAHQIRPDLTWDEFRNIIIQAVQPSLGTVVALTQLQNLQFEGDIVITFSQTRKLILATYPTAHPNKMNNHIFAAFNS